MGYFTSINVKNKTRSKYGYSNLLQFYEIFAKKEKRKGGTDEGYKNI